MRGVKPVHFSPLLYSFLAGVAATVSVNFLTSLASGSTQPAWRLGLAAIPWAVLSVLLAWAGATVEEIREEASAIAGDTMDAIERRANLAATYLSHPGRLRALLGTACVMLVASATLMPILFTGQDTHRDGRHSPMTAPAQCSGHGH